MGSGASNEQRSLHRELTSSASFSSASGARASPLRTEAISRRQSEQEVDVNSVKWELNEEVDAGVASWIRYPDDISLRIEEGYRKRHEKPEVQVVVRGRLYTINFHSMAQKSATGPEKQVKRVMEDDASVRRRRKDVDPFKDDLDSPEQFKSAITSGVSPPECYAVIHAHEMPIYGAVMSVDGHTMVTGCRDGTVKCWEVDSSYVRTEFEAHPGAVLCCDMSSRKPLVVTGCDDKKIRVFDVESAAAKAELEGHEHKVYTAKFTRDGKQILSGAMDCTMRLWDLTTFKEIRQVKAHSAPIFYNAISPRSPELVLSTSDDLTMVSHDLRMRDTVISRFMGHEKTLWGCDVRYDEGEFVSCGMDGLVLFWDPRNPSVPMRRFTPHMAAIHFIEYMPDGASVMTASRDRTFKMLDAASGITKWTIAGHNGSVFKASYHALTNMIMTCGADSKVKFWQNPV